jgi:hypothetical protein
MEAEEKKFVRGEEEEQSHGFWFGKTEAMLFNFFFFLIFFLIR